MITGNSTLLQMRQLYLREIKSQEHQNWQYNVRKYHNIATANRKSHNYAVQKLVKQVQLDYSIELAKLAQLVINNVIPIRRMASTTIDIAIFKLSNNIKIL